MSKFTTLAISQDDHLKLKLICVKQGVPMMKLLHLWISTGCIIASVPIIPQPAPAPTVLPADPRLESYT